MPPAPHPQPPSTTSSSSHRGPGKKTALDPPVPAPGMLHWASNPSPASFHLPCINIWGLNCLTTPLEKQGTPRQPAEVTAGFSLLSDPNSSDFLKAAAAGERRRRSRAPRCWSDAPGGAGGLSPLSPPSSALAAHREMLVSMPRDSGAERRDENAPLCVKSPKQVQNKHQKKKKKRPTTPKQIIIYTKKKQEADKPSPCLVALCRGFKLLLGQPCPSGAGSGAEGTGQARTP